MTPSALETLLTSAGRAENTVVFAKLRFYPGMPSPCYLWDSDSDSRTYCVA